MPKPLKMSCDASAYYGSPWRTVHFELEYINERSDGMRQYAVMLKGRQIGAVYRGMATFERRTPGRRYVNARWTSPRWFGSSIYPRKLEVPRDHTTRAGAAEDVVQAHLQFLEDTKYAKKIQNMAAKAKSPGDVQRICNAIRKRGVRTGVA